MIPHTIRYTRLVIEAIYKIPRGQAAEVSEAIKALGKDPRPPHAFEIERKNSYAMKVAGYFVTYEIVEAERLIIVLLVEKEDQPET